MAIENRIPADDRVFDDNFDFLEGASLADLYVADLQGGNDAAELSAPRPYPIWRSRYKAYAWDYGIEITPETYHPAVDLDNLSGAEIGEMAHDHYKKMRELGLKVVGHMFEPIDEKSEMYELHPKYPTILVAKKYPTQRRATDRPDGMPENAIKGYNFSDIVGGRIDFLAEFGELNLSADDYDEMAVKPLDAYISWCKESDQPYMHTSAISLPAYFYHMPQRSLLLQEISTMMGKTNYEGNFVPAGAFWTAEQSMAWLHKYILELTGTTAVSGTIEPDTEAGQP